MIVGHDEQRQGLRQSFEQDLVLSMYGAQADPGNVLSSASCAEVGALQAVAEDFVEGELPGSHFREARVPEVEPQSDTLAGAVEPVRPVGVLSMLCVHGPERATPAFAFFAARTIRPTPFL